MLKYAAGILIPSCGAIVFNLMNFFIEHRATQKMPPLPDSTFEIASGCAFAMVGVAVAIEDKSHVLKIFAVFCLLILFILFFSYLSPVIFGISKVMAVWATNFVSLSALAWAISLTA